MGLIEKDKIDEVSANSDEEMSETGSGFAYSAYDMLKVAYDVLKHNTLLPTVVTNGDMMRALFPDCEVSMHKFMDLDCGVDVTFYFRENECFTFWCPTSWWNAPFKQGVMIKNENKSISDAGIV